MSASVIVCVNYSRQGRSQLFSLITNKASYRGVVRIQVLWPRTNGCKDKWTMDKGGPDISTPEQINFNEMGSSLMKPKIKQIGFAQEI